MSVTCGPKAQEDSGDFCCDLHTIINAILESFSLNICRL